MEDYLSIAKSVILKESNALLELSNNLSHDEFIKLVNSIVNLNGKVIFTGIGKSGYIAQKLASSFSSTGTVSFFLHPTEASHGDLGVLQKNDILILLSSSGESLELLDIVKYCKRFCIKIAVITMSQESTIALYSDFILLIPKIDEAFLSIPVPTISSLMMLSLGDALISTVYKIKGFTVENFFLYHPGGKIGANLIQVSKLMKKEEAMPLVRASTTFVETILVMNRKALGCAIVVNEDLEMIGIITDGDLRRHINDKLSIKFASDVMSINPKYIYPNTLVSEALVIMQQSSITSLPVLSNNKVVGVIHIHDLLRSNI